MFPGDKTWVHRLSFLAAIALLTPTLLVNGCDKESTSEQAEANSENPSDASEESGEVETEEKGSQNDSESNEDSDKESVEADLPPSDDETPKESEEEEAGETEGEEEVETMEPAEAACPQFENPPLQGPILIGQPVPQYESFDSYNETFNLCEVAGEVPVLVIVSAGWCQPCRRLAHYLATGEGDFPPVKEAVDEGRIRIVEYMMDDGNTDPEYPDPLTFLKFWHDTYPNENVRVAYASQEFFLVFGADQSVPDFGLVDLDYTWRSSGWGALNIASAQ